jgi:hypothetical protein
MNPEPVQGWYNHKKIWSWYEDGTPATQPHHISEEAFDRLSGGFPNCGYRSYWSKEEAMQDLNAALADDVPDEPFVALESE